MPDTPPTDAVVLARVAIAGHRWSEALDLFAAAIETGTASGMLQETDLLGDYGEYRLLYEYSPVARRSNPGRP